MDLCKSFANNKDECYAHVTDDERDVLRNEGNDALQLLLPSRMFLERTFFTLKESSHLETYNYFYFYFYFS